MKKTGYGGGMHRKGSSAAGMAAHDDGRMAKAPMEHSLNHPRHASAKSQQRQVKKPTMANTLGPGSRC